MPSFRALKTAAADYGASQNYAAGIRRYYQESSGCFERPLPPPAPPPPPKEIPTYVFVLSGCP